MKSLLLHVILFISLFLGIAGIEGCASSAQRQSASYPLTTQANPFPGSRFYVSTGKEKQTSVIMLHGSGGGSQYPIDIEAAILATQGFSVLTYCYFDCSRGFGEDRKTLKDVDVTKLFDAITWLRQQPTSNQKVVVYGFSRGAELALIVGSLASTEKISPDAIIAHAPADDINGPWNTSWRDPACWVCKKGRNKCPAHFAFTKDRWPPVGNYEWNRMCGPEDPDKTNFSKSAWIFKDGYLPLRERIQIEKFDKPILITVGEKDEIWPYDQTKRIEATLNSALNQPGHQLEVHYFPSQGHIFFGPDEMERKRLVLKFLNQITSDGAPARTR